MNVLITGGAGYIGSVLVPLFLSKGHTVTVLDNFRTGYRTSLLSTLSNYPLLTIVEGDARNANTLREALIGQAVVIPLAAVVGAPACDHDPITARMTNRDAIEILLAFRESNQKIIWPCSNSGYGVGEKGIFCTEETPMRPVSLYGQLKVETESLLLAEKNTVSLRLATTFGVSPSMCWNLLVNDFVYRAVNDHSVVLYEHYFMRNYIHVRDVARAFLHVLEHFEQMKGQAYNVGLSTANLSKLELCKEIQKQVPNFDFAESAIGHDPDQRNYVVSNAKIEGTGFLPLVSLQEGIAELIKASKIVLRERRDY